MGAGWGVGGVWLKEGNDRVQDSGPSCLALRVVLCRPAGLFDDHGGVRVDF